VNSAALFNIALCLESPWQVEDVLFSEAAPQAKELHLRIGFAPGSWFPDESGALCPVHDTVEREWQHLNFFQYRCFLNCAVPRITTTTGRITTVVVPWARPGSGYYPYV